MAAPDTNYRRLKITDGYYHLSPETRAENLCDHCGVLDYCSIRKVMRWVGEHRSVVAEVKRCPLFVPVMTFRVPLVGLEGAFNTFRLGAAAARRMKVGGLVALSEAGSLTRFGYARVYQTAVGEKEQMLLEHAYMNHTMLQLIDPSPAPELLRTVLNKSYGPLLVREAKELSVIYLKRETGGDVRAEFRGSA